MNDIPEIERSVDSLKELFEDLDPRNPFIAFEFESARYRCLYNPFGKISNFIIQNFDVDSETYINRF